MSVASSSSSRGRVSNGPEVLSSLEQQFEQEQDNVDLRECLRKIYRTAINELRGAGYRLGKDQDIFALRQIEVWIRKALRLGLGTCDPAYIEEHYELALVLHYLGKENECLDTVQRAIDLQAQLAEQHPLGKYNIRFLQTRSATATNIGHLISEPEFFIKAMALGWYPSYHGMLLLPLKDIVNKCGIDYWRRYVNVISDERLVKRLRPLSEHLEHNSFWLKTPEGQMLYFWSGLHAVQKQWEANGYAPLLQLTSKDKMRGWNVLREMGIPDGAWFVSLHVRDQSRGKNGLPIESSSTSHRDADIDTYTAAIKAITDRGGWVIRLGDKSMKPMKRLHQAIDYPHSRFKSDFMDMFLVAESKFLLGSASGVNCIPSNFGVPSLLTNMSPVDTFGLSRQDIYLPKLFINSSTRQLLPFKQCFREPFHHACSNEIYKTQGVWLVDNTPDELAEAVSEMLERLEGGAHYSDEDEILQQRFKDIAGYREPYGINSRIGRDFIRKYEHLLD